MPTQTDWVAHTKTGITKTPVLAFEFSSTVTGISQVLLLHFL